MRPLFSIIMFIILVSFSSPSSEFEIKWGTPSQEGGMENSYFPLGWSQNHYYTIQTDGKTGTLIDCDGKLDIAKQSVLMTSQKKFDADIAFSLNGKVNVIGSDYSKDDKAGEVTVTTFGLDGKQSGAKEKMILKVPATGKGALGDYTYYFSIDTGTLLIIQEHDVKKDDPAKLSFAVVKTADYSKVWSTSVEMPYEDGQFSLLTAAINNRGDVLILASVKGKEGQRLEKYSTRYFTFTNKTATFTEKELILTGKYISSARIRFIGEDQLMATGFYNDLTNTGKNEGIEGAFVATAEVGKPESLSIKSKPLTAQVKAAVTHTGALSSLLQSDEMNAYNIQVMDVNKDGSGYVVAEQRFIHETQEGNTVRRAYYFNHLVFYRFNSSQEIQWISTIPKVQVTFINAPKIGIGPVAFWSFPGYMIRFAYKYNSFVSTEKDGKIYILYNDHRDNGDAKSVKDVKTMSNKNKALATLVTVDESGKWARTGLFRGKDLEVILETSGCHVNEKGGIVISAERGKTLQYGLLNL
ncbi:MAG: hypothetical protein ABI729_05040 [Chitinophagales bacterium]